MGWTIAEYMQRHGTGTSPTECWPWRGEITSHGYGIFRIGGRRMHAHRASYMHHVGEIPAGLVVDHLCRNRACVNPAHLEAVTQAENTRRGLSSVTPRRRTRRAATSCFQGHPYTAENVRVRSNGGRECRACERDRRRAVSGST